MRSRLLLLAVLCLGTATFAAPLFPDIPDAHWARDAMASLSRAGLVEGYPDGTFKGDRAVSRWELAMIVARALQKHESASATFATRAELDELRRLVDALRPELDALGVRVGNLEQNVSSLDRRVTELERISFYGYLETRMTMQSFHNDGAADNSGGGPGAVAGPIPYLDYNSLVGTAVAAPWRPQVQGVIPVVDYRVGRALTNGTGFSSLAVLGMKIQVSPTLRAGAEFAGYASAGDRVVDAYWGVSAPWASNPFTALAGNDQSHNSAPYTRMTLDKFWLEHTPSKTRVNLGNIEATTLDSFVFAGQPNIGVFGPRRWPGFGFQILGKVPVGGDSALSYEVTNGRFGNGVRFEGRSYLNNVTSGKLAYEFERGKVQGNFSRMIEEAPSGGNALGVGLINGINVAYGASPGWATRQWVNPPGYYVGQVGQPGIGVPGNTVDTRPITGWNAGSDDAVGFGPGAGNYGPQSQDSYGVSFNYRIPLDSEKSDLRLVAEFGRSDYRPNRNSGFTSEGDMMRLAADARLFKERLDLGLEYLTVDPNYNPASWSGNVTGVRFATNYNFTGTFHLHDFNRYPHNREGWRARAKYSFAEKRAVVWAEGSLLHQARTSLYDVRVTPGALGAGTPTGSALGFAPGFVDTVFSGYATPLMYGANSRSSFTADLTPLEDPRGRQRDLLVGASYAWPDDGLKLTASFQRVNLRRDSALSAAQGGSQNLVDIDCDWLALSAGFPVGSRVRGFAGLDVVTTSGHHDPAGLFNLYALNTGSTDFVNVDSRQLIPNFGFDWKVAQNTDFNLTLRYYDTEDRVSSSVASGNATLGQTGSAVHPFNWSGLQVTSQFQLRF